MQLREQLWKIKHVKFTLTVNSVQQLFIKYLLCPWHAWEYYLKLFYLSSIYKGPLFVSSVAKLSYKMNSPTLTFMYTCIWLQIPFIHPAQGRKYVCMYI